MKRIWSALITLSFIVIVYAFAQTAGIYRLEDKNIREDRKDNSGQWEEDHVTGISFEHGVTQEDIIKIAKLKNLKYLDITISDIERDIDLSPLGDLTELQELSIYFYAD